MLVGLLPTLRRRRIRGFLAAGTTFPVPGAIFDADFARDRYSGPALSITGGANGNVLWADGVWRSGRRSDLGRLVEEQRTNGVRNTDLQGAATGSPGTLPNNWVTSALQSGQSLQVVGVGTQYGVNYIDLRVSGTPTASGQNAIGMDASQVIPLTGGSATTLSVFVGRSAGSFAGTSNLGFQVNEFNSSNGYLASRAFFPAITTDFLRLPYPWTPDAAAAKGDLFFVWNVTSGTPVDFTIRIGGAQIETGAFATSLIRATTAPATRPNDIVSASLGQTVGEVTILACGRPMASVASAAAQDLTVIHDGSTANRVGLRRGGTNGVPARLIVSGGTVVVNQPIGGAAVWAQDARGAVGYSAVAGRQRAAFNGVLDTGTTTVAMPSGLGTVNVGVTPGPTQWFNGLVERVVVLPRAVSDAELQAMATTGYLGG